ncbi:carbohydrate ABC transporter permease [Enterococcus gallinarum]|uniref:Sugar ABC transporter permease n=1 Tax=Enterococcus gallinarum TaxID=1353 RepID=A0AAE7MRC5_ENTGA|nr:sugar ABC transporter permease [Enterococcus gallinarum]MBM6740118.1 sugar ABC transporter permease [Enterococcus gallinarum]MBO6418973.1 sugar ABC transporter permease [Enterococcus gallinarum]MBO6420481.1 sugar ABC transporter permease [Enterococcus gallinarum]MDT2678595.1 sugar ABC transporter permease [Enterococcus gallinarum]QOG28238.1 sugar ABC transporter permease [Enterococcus gallinarum]
MDPSRKRREVWKFISFAMILSSIFMIYPILYSIYLSLHTMQGLQSVFVGLDNYVRMFQDTIFHKALFNNFVFLIFQVPIMVFLGLLLAFVLNTPKLVGRTFFKLALFLPSVTSLVSYAVLFKMMFQIGGIINRGLLAIGIIQQPLDWLNSPFWAKVTVIIALCWRWTGYNMIFYLAGLQNISDDTLEAADIDGANSFQKFFRIIIPQLKPVIVFTTITSTIGTIQLFDEVVNLTGGGPSNATLTAAQLIYNHSFVYTSNFGYSATLSWALVVIIAVLSYAQFRLAKDDRQ